MADEAQDPTPAVEEVTEQTINDAEAVVEEPKKSVKFEANELTFDEAQAEIDAIKARAGQARENLKSVPTNNYTTSSYSHYTPSSASAGDEVPKSKNMLSHLNSNSAMINYKVSTARNLVQKQEALLRNLKMMRENMERSSVEISRASDYYSPVRVPARGYFEKRAESAPLISRRQVREVSPVVSSSSKLETTERVSERAYSPKPVSISSHISTLPPTVSSADYQPDEDFEKEMAALRKRVANLSKQANEVPTPRYSSYDYESSLLDTYLGGQTDPCALPDTKIEVKSPRTHKFASPKTLHTKTTSRDVYTKKHASDDNGMSYPRNSYTDYLMEVVNDLDNHPSSNHLDMKTLYSNPLETSITDYPTAY